MGIVYAVNDCPWDLLLSKIFYTYPAWRYECNDKNDNRRYQQIQHSSNGVLRRLIEISDLTHKPELLRKGIYLSNIVTWCFG